MLAHAIAYDRASPPTSASCAPPGPGAGRPPPPATRRLPRAKKACSTAGSSTLLFLLLPDPRGLAGQPAQVVELRAAHLAPPHDLHRRHVRRVEREDPLDAHARRHLADHERLVDASAAPADAHPLERLEALLVAFAHPHHHLHRVAGAKGGQVGTEPLAPDRRPPGHRSTPPSR